jgi:hypothetical protein
MDAGGANTAMISWLISLSSLLTVFLTPTTCRKDSLKPGRVFCTRLKQNGDFDDLAET